MIASIMMALYSSLTALMQVNEMLFNIEEISNLFTPSYREPTETKIPARKAIAEGPLALWLQRLDAGIAASKRYA